MATENEILDDVPPLEDMTEYVNRLKNAKSDTTSGNSRRVDCTSPSKPPQTTTTAVTVDRSLLKLEEDGSAFVDRPSLLVVKNGGDKQVKKTETSCRSTSGSGPGSGPGFGGMKKGFLSGAAGKRGGTRNKSNADSEKKSNGVHSGADIPLLTSKKEVKDDLRLQEVQDELKKTYPLLSTTDWVTEDLLAKIDKNPVLSRAFTDPNLFKVLEEFHKNPQQVLAAAESNPEVKEFLQQFCSMMGDHFTAMADSQEKRNRQPPHIISEQATEDERQLQRLLNNPEVKAALLDPDVVKLMEILKSNPDEAQRFLKSIESKPQIQTKLRTLIDNGLLSVQRT